MGRALWFSVQPRMEHLNPHLKKATGCRGESRTHPRLWPRLPPPGPLLLKLGQEDGLGLPGSPFPSCPWGQPHGLLPLTGCHRLCHWKGKIFRTGPLVGESSRENERFSRVLS